MNNTNNCSQTIVETENLCQYFTVPIGGLKSGTLKALDGVSLKIFRGEVLGVVGESGCGKTTLGRSILHLYKPSSGRVLFCNMVVGDELPLPELRRRAAMVFQDPYSSLDPRMTVADIIGEPLDVQGLCNSREERRDKILSLMRRVGLNREHSERYAHEFSGGQRQRIGIARALATEPEFIVCDEPVSALDVSIRAQIINTFASLRDELSLTYLFIAHDLLVVRHISDRIAVMYLGRIVEIGKSEDVYKNPLHPYTKALISSVPIPDPKSARKARRIILPGEPPSPMSTPSGCAFAPRCPYARRICREGEPHLTEVASGHSVRCCRAAEIN